MNKKRLYRIEDGKKLFGVCGGIAEYFNVDPVLIRILWIILCFGYGSGILAYIVCAMLMPSQSEI